jgi:hypothetical protein
MEDKIDGQEDASSQKTRSDSRICGPIRARLTDRPVRNAARVASTARRRGDRQGCRICCGQARRDPASRETAVRGCGTKGAAQVAKAKPAAARAAAAAASRKGRDAEKGRCYACLRSINRRQPSGRRIRSRDPAASVICGAGRGASYRGVFFRAVTAPRQNNAWVTTWARPEFTMTMSSCPAIAV